VDPSRPDLCGSCAARDVEQALGATLAERSSAGSSWGVQAQTAQAAGAAVPQLVVRPRPLDGLLTGVAGAGLAGVAWWALATQLTWDWWPLLSVLVGLAIGLAVVVGARRGGPAAGAVAFGVGLLTVPVTAYFIARSIDIRDAVDPVSIPLWTDLGGAKDLVKGLAEADKAKAVAWLGAPLVAAVVAGWPGRRPIGG
jgi:hypothetical protein